MNTETHPPASNPPTCPTCDRALPTAGALAHICAACALRADLLADSADAEPSQEALATAFKDLSIGEEIGRGGMGIVYRARQVALDRPVALKILKGTRANQGARFEREAKALARLSHPHIVAVYDVGVADGFRYLTMELVSGRSLRDVLHAGPIEPARAILIATQIAQGLRYAHGQGVIHRDIKPENLLLDEVRIDDPGPRIKIADFGLARIADAAKDGAALTGRADVLGTIAYMAPEQARDAAQVDHRADLYALGVVLYEMLTGELPLGVFPSPSATAAVDPRIDGVVRRLLEREPARRYRDASALLDDLAGIEEGAVPRSEREECPEWVAAVPCGPSTVAVISLFAASAIIGGIRMIEPGAADHDLFAAAYPLAVLPLIAIPWRAFAARGMGTSMFGAGLLLISAALASATATLLLQSDHPGLAEQAGQALAATLLVISHAIFHRFVLGGRLVFIPAAAAVYLSGIVLHCSYAQSPSREAYYSGFGMAAVLGVGSVLATLPAVLRGGGREDAYALLRAVALAGIGAVFYFHRYLF